MIYKKKTNLQKLQNMNYGTYTNYKSTICFVFFVCFLFSEFPQNRKSLNNI